MEAVQKKRHDTKKKFCRIEGVKSLEPMVPMRGSLPCEPHLYSVLITMITRLAISKSFPSSWILQRLDKMEESSGYDKLARFMVNEQYAIFRQFKSTANRDLLFLQAELAHLEEEFAALSGRDKVVDGEQELYNRNWYLLSTSRLRGCGGEQWDKALQIRMKLREYCPRNSRSKSWASRVANFLADDFVSRYSEIANMPQARNRDLTMLREWISRPDLGGGIAFSGNDLNLGGGSVYDEKHLNDLMTLTNRIGENDPFTRFLAGPVFHKFERIWRHVKVSYSQEFL
jgi:hypothetical protein